MCNQKFITWSVYNFSKKNYVKKLSFVYKHIPTNQNHTENFYAYFALKTTKKTIKLIKLDKPIKIFKLAKWLITKFN